MINFDQLIVGLIFLVPGFISTAAEKAFQPRRFDSAYEWTTSSLLRSIGLNIVAFTTVALLGYTKIIEFPIESIKINLIGDYLQNVTISTALIYVFILYAASAIWGILLGTFPNLTFRELANRLKLTSLGRQDSVWARVKEKQRPSDRPFTWIKITLDNNKVLYGRLRHASSIVDQDKPIELFLKPVHEIIKGKLHPIKMNGQETDGIYLKLGEAHLVEFYFMSKEVPDHFQLDVSHD